MKKARRIAPPGFYVSVLSVRLFAAAQQVEQDLAQPARIGQHQQVGIAEDYPAGRPDLGRLELAQLVRPRRRPLAEGGDRSDLGPEPAQRVADQTLDGQPRVEALGRVLRHEGAGALYKGFWPKVVRLAPGGGLMLLVVDAITSYVRVWLGPPYYT